MKTSIKCPKCKRKLNLKKDVTVDKNTGAVYCSYCDEFLGYVEDFLTEELEGKNQ